MKIRFLKYLVFSLLFAFIVFLPVNVSAQLMELEVEQSVGDGPIPVFRDFPDKSGVIVRSSITNLRFDSTFEIIDERSNPDEGTYRIILEPVNQYLSVNAPGFMTNRIQLNGLNTREVRFYDIEPYTYSNEGEGSVERTFQEIKDAGVDFFENREFYLALDRFNDALRLRPNDMETTRYKVQTDDEIQWQEAILRGTVESYEAYLEGETSKRHANAAIDSIMATNIKMGELYAKNNNIERAENYLESYLIDFPAGPDIAKANQLLCNLYTENGDAYSQQENLNGQRSALNFYNKSLDYCTNQVSIEPKIQQTQKLYDRFQYPRRGNTLFTTDRISTYGISFLSLNYFERAGFLTLRFNQDIFTSRSDLRVDSEGRITDESSISSNSNYESLGITRQGNAEALTGFTFPVYFPIWIYFGGGYSYNPAYLEVARRSSAGDILEKEWALDRSERKNGIIFELGTVVSYYGLTIGVGLKGLDTSNLTPTFSVGFMHSPSE